MLLHVDSQRREGSIEKVVCNRHRRRRRLLGGRIGTCMRYAEEREADADTLVIEESFFFSNTHIHIIHVQIAWTLNTNTVTGLDWTGLDGRTKKKTPSKNKK